ncbi:HlyD family secretion protein [Sphingomonas sp. Leaf357]|uniref:HlyD family secretion protein n=1 Tax=Sphingomonas sp. Leaf357 TaxID=1736350 RepID=UPI0009E91B86|nr:HlyD family secretion protein [Sphingomonas sp. Leaf357]
MTAVTAKALQTDAPRTDAQPRRRSSGVRRPIIIGLIAAAIAAAGLFYLLGPRTSEVTDNAFVKADSTSVAPRVGGLIAEVLVRDNQIVRAGDPLIRIDAQEYDARRAAAEAGVADAAAGVATARAALAALAADEGLAAARVRVARTSIGSAEAEYARAASDRTRFEALVGLGFATRRDAERVRADAIGADAARDRSRADRDVTLEQAAVAHARRPVLVAELARAQAAEARARATLALSRQDSDFTLIRAPISGVVGNRQAQTGDFVQPGTRLLTIVPTRGYFVIANFKETQTRHMSVGQPASISVDALGGGELTGRVESFAPASGSEYALLPFEPGSGNFTKIVQRIPVRIRLDPDQAMLGRLRSGLSVTARVRVQ